MLVPLYASFWASEPGRTADGQTLPTGFNVPAKIIAVNDIPRTKNGKIT